MSDGGYVTLDTRAFDSFISQKEAILSRYNEINDDYDSIVRTLLENWIGEGADAFAEDASNVKANIVGIYDILKTMCDTLTDCRQIFEECDTSLGEYNRNPE